MKIAQWFIGASLFFMAAHTLVYTDNKPAMTLHQKGTSTVV